MAKQRSLVKDYLVYLAVRLFICTLQCLPFDTAKRLALGCAWLCYHVDKRHRLVALENLRLAFPGKYDETELHGLVLKVYEHLWVLVIEMVFMGRLVHPHNWSRTLHYSDRDASERFNELLLAGRSVMLVTGHFGNWEIPGYLFGLLGFSIHSIARPIDNPFLDRYLTQWRESTGQKLLAKKGDFDQIEVVLDQRGFLATLADQDAGRRGLFVDFFGRPASTHKAIALLCIEHRVPIAVAGAARVGDPMVYRVYFEDLIMPEEYADHPDALRAITQRFSKALETLIRRHPDQYLWLHRRWKSQPKVKARKQKAA